MSVILQIAFGTALLFVCILIHIAILIGARQVLLNRHPESVGMSSNMDLALSLGIALGAIVGGLTIEVLLFALSVLALGSLPDIGEAIYFALVTYTTLGYGDVTLSTGFRIFGAFGSVTGLLVFGLSTAALASLFARLVSPGVE
jgi:hypothetical protein